MRTKHTLLKPVILERAKQSKDLVKVATQLIRPNIWLIPSKFESSERKECTWFYYGASTVKVYGTLYEKDFGVWLTMLSMAIENKNQPYISDNLPVDIAKAMGAINPWQPTTINPILDSFERLLDVSIKIRPTEEIGFKAKFCLIEGYLESDNRHGSFSVTPYYDIVKLLILGQTILSRQTYYSIKSQIGQSLYKFLIPQQIFYSGQGYEIRLALLCKYLNYNLAGRPWWEIYPIITEAINELKHKGIIGRYTHEKNRCKSEGGVLTFYPVKKQPKQLSVSTTNNETIKLIQDKFSSIITWTDGSENKFRIALNKVTKFLEPYQISSIQKFIEKYCNWLQEKKLEYISPVLFTPENEFFQEYIKMLKDNTDELKIEQKHSKPKKLTLTPEQEKDLGKRRKEARRKREEHIKNLKCPFGHIIGKDWDEFTECFKCKMYEVDCENLSRKG